jgi:hypothetical protein
MGGWQKCHAGLNPDKISGREMTDFRVFVIDSMLMNADCKLSAVAGSTLIKWKFNFGHTRNGPCFEEGRFTKT